MKNTKAGHAHRQELHLQLGHQKIIVQHTLSMFLHGQFSSAKTFFLLLGILTLSLTLSACMYKAPIFSQSVMPQYNFIIREKGTGESF